MQTVTVKKQLWKEIDLPYKGQTIRVEVACERVIDFGILNDSNAEAFSKASSDKGIEKILWCEEIKGLKSVDINLPLIEGEYILILWNAYEDIKVFITYNITVIN